MTQNEAPNETRSEGVHDVYGPQINYVHDELALSLAKLVRVRMERDQAALEYAHQIEDLEHLIERQVFECLPGIEDQVCYGDGDPIEFFVGAHRVRLYSIKGKPEIAIDRTHALETAIDLFAEAERAGGLIG